MAPLDRQKVRNVNCYRSIPVLYTEHRNRLCCSTNESAKGLGMFLRVVVNILAVAVLLILMFGVGRQLATLPREPQTRRGFSLPPLVQAPPITAHQAYRLRIAGYGTLRPSRPTQIAAQVEGTVESLGENFHTGRPVHKGDLLVQIDEGRLRAHAEKAAQLVAAAASRLEQLRSEQANLQAEEVLTRQQLELSERRLQQAREAADPNGDEGDLGSIQAAHLAILQRSRQIENALATLPARRRELEAHLAAAQADRIAALEDLATARMVSPVDGWVLHREVEPGQYVRPGQMLGVLSDGSMEAVVSVRMSDLPLLRAQGLPAPPVDGIQPYREGDPPSLAEVTWSDPLQGVPVRCEGVVDRIIPDAGEANSSATVVIALRDSPGMAELSSACPPRPDLRIGCRADIAGVVADRAFVVPREAIQPDQTVFVVIRNPSRRDEWQLKAAPVEATYIGEHEAVILPGAGLQEGDQVVISRLPEPIAGLRVRLQAPLSPEPVQPPATQGAQEPSGREQAATGAEADRNPAKLPGTVSGSEAQEGD